MCSFYSIDESLDDFIFNDFAIVTGDEELIFNVDKVFGIFYIFEVGVDD